MSQLSDKFLDKNLPLHAAIIPTTNIAKVVKNMTTSYIYRLDFSQIYPKFSKTILQHSAHLKGLIVGFLNPEDWGRGILIGLPRPLFMIN